MRSVHSANVAAFREAIRSNDERRACFLSQRGFLGTAWLSAPGSGATAMAGEVFRLKVLDYLGLPWAEVAGLPCKQCRAPLSAAGAFHHAESCGTSTSRHDAFLRAVDTVFRSAGGGSVRATGLGEGAFYPAQPTHRPDRLYGCPNPGERPLVVDAVLCSCRTLAALCGAGGASAVTTAGWAAEAAHRRKLAVAEAGGLDGSRHAFLPIAVELQGWLHPEVQAWLRSLARRRAEADLGGAPEAQQVQRAAQLLVAWQRHLSVALAVAHVGYMRERVAQAVAHEQAGGPRGPVEAGSGALLAVGSLEALRELGVLGLRSVDEGLEGGEA